MEWKREVKWSNSEEEKGLKEKLSYIKNHSDKLNAAIESLHPRSCEVLFDNFERPKTGYDLNPPYGESKSKKLRATLEDLSQAAEKVISDWESAASHRPREDNRRGVIAYVMAKFYYYIVSNTTSGKKIGYGANTKFHAFIEQLLKSKVSRTMIVEVKKYMDGYISAGQHNSNSPPIPALELHDETRMPLHITEIDDMSKWKKYCSMYNWHLDSSYWETEIGVYLATYKEVITE